MTYRQYNWCRNGLASLQWDNPPASKQISCWPASKSPDSRISVKKEYDMRSTLWLSWSGKPECGCSYLLASKEQLRKLKACIVLHGAQICALITGSLSIPAVIIVLMILFSSDLQTQRSVLVLKPFSLKMKRFLFLEWLLMNGSWKFNISVIGEDKKNENYNQCLSCRR